MALVTGTLKDILGYNYTSRRGEIRFTPNEPGVRITGAPGQVVPTSHVKATIEANGDFSVDLANTNTFLTDMWYRMQIMWQDSEAGATLMDFPDWQIRVTGAGSIADMISFGPSHGGSGGNNPNRGIWWVGLTDPPNRNYVWLHMNPDNIDDPAASGDIREWR